jgi:hypothetical protein
MTETAAEIEKQQLQMLHGVMRFVVQSIPADEKFAEPDVQAITGQPIFEKFRQILNEIPSVDSVEDLRRFALQRESIQEIWTSSMQFMDVALQDNFFVQNIVDQFMHHSGEMKTSLLADTADKVDPEILAPILNMLSLWDSDAVDREKLTDWQKSSGNVFGLARYEGGKAEISALGKKAVKKRMAQDPTNPLKEKIKQHWSEALKVKGSDNGMKTHFVRRMQELVKTEGKGIVVPDRTINDWTLVWGGKLQKSDRSRTRP